MLTDLCLLYCEHWGDETCEIMWRICLATVQRVEKKCYGWCEKCFSDAAVNILLEGNRFKVKSSINLDEGNKETLQCLLNFAYFFFY